MRFVILVFCSAFFLLFPGFALAGSCPAGAADCFLCGGVDGIPCTTDCPGKFVEGVGNVACECPQGEPCVCHCPVTGGSAQVKDDLALIEGAPACEQTACLGQNCGVVQGLRNKVAVQRDGEWCLASGGLVVNGGTKVWVPEGSMVSIRLFDGGNVDVKENSVFYLESLEVDEEGGTGRMILRMADGVMHYLMSSDRIEQFEVRPNGAVIGIEGTEFIVEAKDSDITVKVLEGAVDFSNAGSGKIVRVGEGEYSTAVDAGGAPTEPAKFNISKEESWWGGSGCGSALILAVLAGAAFAMGRS